MSNHARGPLQLVCEAPRGGGFVVIGSFLVSPLWARASWSLIVSNMKRDASLARRPLKPARAVHVRLSQAYTQIVVPSLDPRLCQATTLATSTPLDPVSLRPRNRPWLLAGLLVLLLTCFFLLVQHLTVLPHRLSHRSLLFSDFFLLRQ